MHHQPVRHLKGTRVSRGGSEVTTQQKKKEVGKEPRQSAPSTSGTSQGDKHSEEAGVPIQRAPN